MLALLAAATLAATASGPAPSAALPEHSLFKPRYEITQRSPSACKAAGRMQTSGPAEPALLFRGQDRPAVGPRRLIDLPRAEMCLLGGAGGSDGR